MDEYSLLLLPIPFVIIVLYCSWPTSFVPAAGVAGSAGRGQVRGRCRRRRTGMGMAMMKMTMRATSELNLRTYFKDVFGSG
jgi:hypothetical protein